VPLTHKFNAKGQRKASGEAAHKFKRTRGGAIASINIFRAQDKLYIRIRIDQFYMFLVFKTLSLVEAVLPLV